MIDIHHLPGSRPNEQTIFLLRRHWFVIIPILFAFLIILALPFAVYFFLNTYHPLILEQSAYHALYIMGAGMFFLYAWLFLFQNFIDWYLDVWIVTNHRIINIEQHGLFGRTMSELMLYNVQDVTSEIKGIVPTLFNYGNVHIQTAGEQERFVFEEVEHCDHIAKRIIELAHIQKIEHQRQGNQEVGSAF